MDAHGSNGTGDGPGAAPGVDTSGHLDAATLEQVRVDLMQLCAAEIAIQTTEYALDLALGVSCGVLVIDNAASDVDLMVARLQYAMTEHQWEFVAHSDAVDSWVRSRDSSSTGDDAADIIVVVAIEREVSAADVLLLSEAFQTVILFTTGVLSSELETAIPAVHVQSHRCFGLALPAHSRSSCCCLLPLAACVVTSSGARSDMIQRVLRPWQRLTQEQAGATLVLAFLRSLHRWQAARSTGFACALLGDARSPSHWPFQLLLMLVRYGRAHPTLLQQIAQPLARKGALLPQAHVRAATAKLLADHDAMWTAMRPPRPGDKNGGQNAATDGNRTTRARTTSSSNSAAEWLEHEVHKTQTDDSRSSWSRLSRCRLWDKQKAFYCAQGISAWSNHIVPFGVSSSSFLAASYARIAIQFLFEAAPDMTNTISDDTPNCYVWEAASGSCKFLHAFLIHFFALVDEYDLTARGIRPCVVASDLSVQVIQSRRTMACFAPFLERRQLDFALFDSEIFLAQPPGARALSLECSKRQWIVGVDGPVLLMANYFFDSLKADVFVVAPCNAGGVPCVFEAITDAASDSIAAMKVGLREVHNPHENPVYDEAAVQQTLMHVVDRIRNDQVCEGRRTPSLVIFPVEAVTLLEALQSQCTQAFAVLVGDADFSFRDPILSGLLGPPDGDEGLEIPQLSPHPDCFCLPVDLEIMKLYCERDISVEPRRSVRQVEVVKAIASDTFNVLLATVLPVSECADAASITRSSSLVHRTFRDELRFFTPSDCDLVYGLFGAEQQAKHLAMDAQLQLLAQVAWDIDLFVVIMWPLLRTWRNVVISMPEDRAFQWHLALAHAGTRCLQNLYTLDPDNQHDSTRLIKLQIARWFSELGFSEPVLRLLADQLQQPDEAKLAELYLLALASLDKGENWQALALFRRCQSARPKVVKYERGVAQALTQLHEARLAAKSAASSP